MGSIDLSEAARDYDERIWTYHVNDDGSETFSSKSAYSAEVAPHMERVLAGESVRVGNRVFRRGKLTRREALDTRAFRLLMSLAEMLARDLGQENVRLVVWFDH